MFSRRQERVMKNAKKNVAGFKSVFYGEKKGSNRKVV